MASNLDYGSRNGQETLTLPAISCLTLIQLLGTAISIRAAGIGFPPIYHSTDILCGETPGYWTSQIRQREYQIRKQRKFERTASRIIPNHWSDGKVAWERTRVCFTDAGGIFALRLLSERAPIISSDLDAHGEIYAGREATDRLLSSSHKTTSIAYSWRDMYVFTGGYNNEGWLIRPVG
ncbi:hypothetical protein N7452_007306 [Penicillium brevicompactum]|uniref:Uncharacterized protein n=1 Tax=Penicillium brevicompactum TaxID=5074 RepID=A0A9W9UFM2_PENBR|nr:hypothetical protein N7452_007306 [Penicillium brevicompactum]